MILEIIEGFRFDRLFFAADHFRQGSLAYRYIRSIVHSPPVKSIFVRLASKVGYNPVSHGVDEILFVAV